MFHNKNRPMDFINLALEIKKEPAAYETDYIKNFENFKVMSQLPIKPEKNYIKLIDFLSKTCKYYESKFASCLVEAFHKEKSKKLRIEIFKYIFHLKITEKISPADFFTIFLESRKKIPFKRLQSEIKKIRTSEEQKKLFLIFKKYLEEGDFAQQKIANYLLIFIYENSKRTQEKEIEAVIINSLFSENFSVAKVSIFYFLNFLKLEIKNENKKNFADIKNENRQKEYNFISKNCEQGTDISRIIDNLDMLSARNLCKKLFNFIKNFKGERSHRIYLFKVIGKLKTEFQIGIKIFDFIVNLIDIRKDDNRVLMSAAIESVSGDEILLLIKKITNIFCQDYRDDDILAYGIELLGQIAYQYEEHCEFIKDIINDYKKIKRKEIQKAYCSSIRIIKEILSK